MAKEDKKILGEVDTPNLGSLGDFLKSPFDFGPLDKKRPTTPTQRLMDRNLQEFLDNPFTS